MEEPEVLTGSAWLPPLLSSWGGLVLQVRLVCRGPLVGSKSAAVNRFPPTVAFAIRAGKKNPINPDRNVAEFMGASDRGMLMRLVIIPMIIHLFLLLESLYVKGSQPCCSAFPAWL